jgi:hypothetical protein
MMIGILCRKQIPFQVSISSTKPYQEVRTPESTSAVDCLWSADLVYASVNLVFPHRVLPQKVYYEIGVENWPPTIQRSRYVVNGSIYLPIQNAIVNISALTANERFRSFAIDWSYVISVPTPGFFWDDMIKSLRVRPSSACSNCWSACVVFSTQS